MGEARRRGENTQHQGSSVQETHASCFRLLDEEEKLLIQEVHYDAPKSRPRALDI